MVVTRCMGPSSWGAMLQQVTCQGQSGSTGPQLHLVHTIKTTELRFLLTCRRQREVCWSFKGSQDLTSTCSLILPLQFSFSVASNWMETERFQDQAWCATCVYDWDTAASQFLHGDSQPLPHYWLDFLGHVQASCTRRCSSGWIWIFVGAGPQGAKALFAASGWLSVRSTSCKSRLCPCSMSWSRNAATAQAVPSWPQ